jgi:hypothetical protein
MKFFNRRNEFPMKRDELVIRRDLIPNRSEAVQHGNALPERVRLRAYSVLFRD